VNHNEKLLEIDSDVAYGANSSDVNKKIKLHASIDKAIKAWNQMSMAFRSNIQYGTVSYHRQYGNVSDAIYIRTRLFAITHKACPDLIKMYCNLLGISGINAYQL